MKISLGGITDNKHNKYFRIEGRLAIMNISKFTQKSVEAVRTARSWLMNMEISRSTRNISW